MTKLTDDINPFKDAEVKDFLTVCAVLLSIV